MTDFDIPEPTAVTLLAGAAYRLAVRCHGCGTGIEVGASKVEVCYRVAKMAGFVIQAHEDSRIPTWMCIACRAK